MVAPIYGPFSSSGDNWTATWAKSRYKQHAPYTVPSPYTAYGAYRTGDSGGGNLGPASGKAWNASTVEGYTETNQARMKAYEKLKNLIADRSSMGENFVDLDKSVKTIVQRARQLLDFTYAVKHGHFIQAANILRTPMPRNKHPVREAANNWLEYHLGIEPVVKDIWTALDRIQQPLDNFHIVAKGNQPRRFAQVGRWWPPMPDKVWEGNIRVRYQCEVAVSNPALWLANSLGILNPVQVVWQVIPLSFVLDWFANVEQFFGTASDFWGLTTLNPQTTLSWSGVATERWGYYGYYATWSYFGVSRSLGLTLPSLGFRPYKATSWQRGATAISLLVGSLNSLDTTNYNGRRRQLKFVEFDRNQQGLMKKAYGWDDGARTRG